MKRLRRHPVITALATLIFVVVFSIAGYGTFLAHDAHMLPWQGEPTRIAITPFADIPGFNQPIESPATPDS